MLQILTLENRLLRKKSRRVANVDDSIRNFAKQMIETMRAANGIGLSAIQVGVLKQIIVVDHQGDALVMINPVITKVSEDQVEMEEGCLSCPDVFKMISRPESLSVKYRDLDGKPHFEKYSGLTARIIQHEILHLYGELIV